ncbi:MAG: glycoside hydrolase [Clostridia bacterium]|nr:glycoside hydrolase [Clostridia bacterium]
MKKVTFGTPEEIVPSRYCKGFCYRESEIDFDPAQIVYRRTPRGVLLEFWLESDEQVYGLGLQLQSFNHRGKKMILRNNSDPIKPTGDSHAPVPFIVTSKCRGFYLDTARTVEVYCGYPRVSGNAADGGMAGSTEGLYAQRHETGAVVMSILVPAAEGVDVYIMEGKNITDVVCQYNMLSGGGCTVPEWGLGMLFRCYFKYTEDEVLEMANHFRERDIPCSIIGLEPGWQTKTYSCSFVPSPERYPHFNEMVAKLRKMGYHVNLWEHCFTHPTSPIYDELLPYAGNFPVWNGLVPDFTLPEAKKVFADYHRRVLVDNGIDGFKLDECDGSDYTGAWSFPTTSEFPGGADGELMRQLLGPLYVQAIQQALDNAPTLSSVRSMGALCASYPFVLYSDLYDHKQFIRGVVNQGFSGLLWSPELRSVGSAKELLRRMQVLVFSTQCLVNAWNCEERCPWFIYDCEDEVRSLLKLRESLIPMLKEAHDRYAATGLPPIRALVMDWSDDAQTWNIDDEYMFCDKLLVAPMTAESDSRRVYLPAGNWVDFYTKEPVAAGWHDVTTESIPVYEMV